MKKTTTISIDLAKDVFQVGVFNKYGKPLTNKAMKSNKMLQLVAQHPEAIILMKTCGSAHYGGRLFLKRGHEVNLLPARIGVNSRLGNKNDANDVVAIDEAAKRDNIYCVAVRTVEQHNIATIHKLRQQIPDALEN